VADLTTITQRIEDHRERRPERPVPFEPHSPEGVAYLNALETWACDLDDLQAEFNGVSNRMFGL